MIIQAAVEAIEGLKEVLRAPYNQPYWLQGKGHTKKRRVRPPYKGIFKSNPARNLYRGDVWWLAQNKEA